MYPLNQTDLHQISGGNLVYVTEEWKQEQARLSGYIGAFAGGIMGVGIAAPSGLSAVLVGGFLGASVGYYFGVVLSALENAFLENNTFYEFSTQYYVVPSY